MYLELNNINKNFGSYQASKEVSFGVEKGKLIGLLGPSGSGKTTILRMIAGLESPDSGDIILDGVKINDVSPSERGIGFVFQSYALFRYMTVYENIAFGLQIQKKKKSFIKDRVTELINLIGLEGLEKRYPHQLSGGQRQRIAFARALAPNPQLLLLDEPFAAVDAKVRLELRSWLRKMIDRLGITSIFVTHDQDEAIEVADEIIVTNNGKIEQIGSPIEIYRNPDTPFVAQFIGQSSVLENHAELIGFENTEKDLNAVIRPEYMSVYKIGEQKQYQLALEDGIVESVFYRGSYLEMQIRVKGMLLTANRSLNEAEIEVGEAVKVLIYRIYLFDDKSTYLSLNQAIDDKDMFYI